MWNAAVVANCHRDKSMSEFEGILYLPGSIPMRGHDC
jgi:hypothetical protein